MKRHNRVLIAVAIASAFASGLALAQNLRAGAKFGIDFADLGGDVEDSKIKTGISAGAFFGADLGTMFRLGIDGQYVQKGAKADNGNVGLGADVALGTGAFAFDLLYNLGLSNINGVAGLNESIKNKNIQITIGYAILFGGS